VLSHEGAGGALRALLLELLDLAVSLNREVLKDLLGALLVSMLDLLGGGVDLLFALTLATLGVNQGGDGALALETGTGDGELVLKLSGTENNAVDVAFGLLLNFGSKGSNRVGSLDINYKLLASRSLHENFATSQRCPLQPACVLPLFCQRTSSQSSGSNEHRNTHSCGGHQSFFPISQ